MCFKYCKCIGIQHFSPFESTAESASGTPTAITGESLEGTVTANGKANITVAFKPGAMPMAITAVFTGNVNETSAQ